MLKRESDLGQLILTERMKKGYSLEDLGRMANANKGHISRIERGIATASRKTLIDIASALGINPSELLALAGLSPITEEDDAIAFASITEKWLLMNTEMRQELNDVATRLLAGYTCTCLEARKK